MKPVAPEPVKLFTGILYSDAEILEQALALLMGNFGRLDFKSQEFKFNQTDYYRAEMGGPIWRKFVSFTKLINPKEIAEIKIATNKIEEQLAVAGQRKVNLDPGYLDYNKVILASAKYNSQKIYLDLGIYADPTLWFENGRYQPYPFAFPDFKTGEYDAVFTHIRALFKGQRRKLNRAEKAEFSN
ncbi:MAG: DUF4416 family protein [bacterium]